MQVLFAEWACSLGAETLAEGFEQAVFSSGPFGPAIAEPLGRLREGQQVAMGRATVHGEALLGQLLPIKPAPRVLFASRGHVGVANHPLRCDAPALHHLLEQGFERLHLRA